ncbi:hypothetical protein FKM82_031019 [Ascaphus truei]
MSARACVVDGIPRSPDVEFIGLSGSDTLYRSYFTCAQDRGVESTIFQNPAKLHLTIGTLVLLNENEVKKACELLQKCKEDFIDKIAAGKPLQLKVAGIEYMNDDPAMVDVLYAKIKMKDGSER